LHPNFGNHSVKGIAVTLRIIRMIKIRVTVKDNFTNFWHKILSVKVVDNEEVGHRVFHKRQEKWEGVQTILSLMSSELSEKG
jgi:hypothetical protein